ncbi:MAG: chromate efflux transporter [Chloroflexota bacterium]|nr:chromate efflux transporter [Chloroflexota bacterium]
MPLGFFAFAWMRGWEVLAVFTKLGLTSFGGPIAHLGYFREELVQRRRWLDDREYADMVALCQVLPGPTSSEVAMAIGIARAGLLGALLAWLGFTAPSAIAMLAFALLVGGGPPARGPLAGALQGLKVVAVAVVAQAVWGMARSLAPDRPRATIAIAAAAAALLWQTPLAQIAIIAAAAVVGWKALSAESAAPPAARPVPISRRAGAVALAAFGLLLLALPLGRAATASPALAVADAFYRAGALVFGGGHVVLPLLAADVVPAGWVTEDQFLAGYGAAQALPGPLFTFAAYLGAVRAQPPAGVIGGLLALGAIFLPAGLLVIGVLPFWDALRSQQGLRSALNGVNAAVVGILLAALYSPVMTSAVHTPLDAAAALIAFLLLVIWAVPPWAVVLLTAAAGTLYSR